MDFAQSLKILAGSTCDCVTNSINIIVIPVVYIEFWKCATLPLLSPIFFIFKQFFG